MKLAAIVPALNEGVNIGNVLKVLLASKDLQEVIVVDDGSVDRTAEIARSLGVKVISLPKKGGSGKANAMKQGIKSTDAEIILFFDADLIGLKQEHITLLIQPILEGRAEMVVGVRGRWLGIPKLFVKIDPLLAIGGERAIKRSVFENLPQEFIKGFMIEIGMNLYCQKKKLPVVYADLENLTMVIKERKWGLLKGFFSRIKMIWEMIKARFILIRRVKI
ncbi:glycosyltransferase family 2 protein [Patescibacteria group bacterium]|nr:glycosyltransferase family 2 protein [Patescibacteria group bacterium]